MITTGQARRLAQEYSHLGEGMAIFSRTGQGSMLARSEVGARAGWLEPERYSYRDPQGAMADARALKDWMDANLVAPEDWATAWDTTVVPWSYGR